jgi:hypothetical protein
MLICSWCDTVIENKPARPVASAAVSHGICPTCLGAQLAARPAASSAALSPR